MKRSSSEGEYRGVIKRLSKYVAVLAFAFATTVWAECKSGNIVGYFGANIKYGDNTIGMPKKVNDELQLVKDVLAGLVDGDEILVSDRFGNELWGHVYDDGVEKHVYVDGIDDPVDDWRLPSVAEEQILKVKRAAEVDTQTSLAGEFDIECPIQLPEYTGEAPLRKIKLGRETAKNLQTEVVVTNRVSVPFPTTVPKKFEMILKDGRRIVVQVDPNTRLIVDAATGRPVNVGAAEIDGFGEIKSLDVPKAEKADTAEIRPIVRDVAKGSREYDFAKAVREGIIGAAWDNDHKVLSVLCWLVIVAVLSLLNKFFDWTWGWIGKGFWWFAVRFIAACVCVAKAWWFVILTLVLLFVRSLKELLGFVLQLAKRRGRVR